MSEKDENSEKEEQTSAEEEKDSQDQVKPAKVEILELSDLMQEYLHEYQQGIFYESQPVHSPIEVDELASKVATLYEKVRRIIDWKEENLVRRTAIQRILKRTLLSELSGVGSNTLDSEKITEPLVMEMIRSGYFSNKHISKDKIPEAEKSLSKYITILNKSSASEKMEGLKIKEKVNFYNWILEIAACEIEEILEPAFKENALINFMTQSIHQRLKIIPSDLVSKEDVLLQTYIATHRTLYGLDSPIIIYNLIKYRYPRWFEDDQEYINEFALNIDRIKLQLESDLNHKYGKHFFNICDRYDAAYLILGDIMKAIEKEPEQMEAELKNKQTLLKTIVKVYEVRIKTLKKRLYRSAVYSTLSILSAGSISLMIFEGPVARLVVGHFSWFAVFVDLAVPSTLMFLLVITIKLPKPENLDRVKEEVAKIVYASKEHDIYEIELNKKKNRLVQGFFGLLSLLGGAVGAYAIFTVFRIAGVPWTSMYIDTVYVAVVIFTALLIRHKAKEVTIEERASLISLFVDFFSLPLAKLGQWFSNKWKEYNILSVFFTALVDTPFSVLISLIEDWRSFLKDQRSQLH